VCPEPTCVFNGLDASHTEDPLYRQEPHRSTLTAHASARGCGGTSHARYAAAVTDPSSTPGGTSASGADPQPDAPAATTAHRLAGVLTALEGLVLVGFAVFYVVEMASGATDNLSRAAVSTVLIVVFGVGLLALARGWFAAAGWPKTPTVLWNALLLPVAWSLREGDRPLIALAVGAVALTSIVAAVAAPRPRREAPDGN
jgi:hypothetical protein